MSSSPGYHVDYREDPVGALEAVLKVKKSVDPSISQIFRLLDKDDLTLSEAQIVDQVATRYHFPSSNYRQRDLTPHHSDMDNSYEEIIEELDEASSLEEINDPPNLASKASD